MTATNEILKKLQAKRLARETEAKKITTDANTRAENPGEFTAEEATRVDALIAEIEAIDKNIQRQTHLSEAVEAGNQPAGRRTMPAGQPGAGPQISGVHDRREDDPMGGFKSVAQFARDVRVMSLPSSGGRMSDTMRNYMEIAHLYGMDVQAAAPSTYHNENSLAESGIPIPPAIREAVWGLVFDGDGLLGQCDVEAVESNSTRVYVDDSVPWATTGVQAYWEGEAVQGTPTKDTPLKPRDLRIGKLTALVPVTEEDLEDAPKLQNRLTVKAASRINWKVDETIMRGDGVNKPLGFMNAGGMISVAKETSQAADTIVAANVAKMYARLLRTPGGSGAWLMNQDCLQQVMQLNLANQLLWTKPTEGFKNAPGGFLLGAPIQFNLHCDTLGDQGDIFFVDLKGYYAARKSNGINFLTSIHLWFDYGITAFRWTFRVNGQPYLNAAVTPPNSAATLSHFVALDARA